MHIHVFLFIFICRVQSIKVLVQLHTLIPVLEINELNKNNGTCGTYNSEYCKTDVD